MNNANQEETTNFNYNTPSPTMLQSVEIAFEESYRELTTDRTTKKEIELSISPFVINNGTNLSESTANEALNHHWTFYIEVGIDLTQIGLFDYINMSTAHFITSACSFNIGLALLLGIRSLDPRSRARTAPALT